MRLKNGEYNAKRKDKEGWSAFTLVTTRFVLSRGTSLFCIAERLLQLGADVDERNPATGATPLVMQSWRSSMEDASGLQLLLRYGADVNAQDDAAKRSFIISSAIRSSQCCVNSTWRVRVI